MEIKLKEQLKVKHLAKIIVELAEIYGKEKAGEIPVNVGVDEELNGAHETRNIYGDMEMILIW